MQDFIATYGIWLLVGLAILIALAFLLRSKGKAAKTAEIEPMPLAKAVLPEEPLTPAPPPVAPTPVIAEPVPVPAPTAGTPIAVPVGEPDNLLRLKGVGPKVNTILKGLGITRYEQIAAWTEADVARIDRQLGSFSGRIVRDQWIDQATYLARGDFAGFEAKYGKL